jgi:hypothetical protein
MGGRGSGGSRGGGGGGSSVDAKQYEINSKSFSQIYKEKFANMSDKELDKAYANSRNLMAKENANLKHEQNKLQKMLDAYKSVKETDSDYKEKSNAIDKQIAKVNDAKSYASAREQIHHLAINERNNVRSIKAANNTREMTNAQLNSFYNKSYKEGNKARDMAEKTNNKKTREKYLKLYEKNSKFFNQANEERTKRGLSGKDW